MRLFHKHIKVIKHKLVCSKSRIQSCDHYKFIEIPYNLPLSLNFISKKERNLIWKEEIPVSQSDKQIKN